MSRDPELLTAEDRYRVPRSEQLAINATTDGQANSIFCTSVGRGQCAIELSRRFEAARVQCHFIESFPASETAMLAQEMSAPLEVVCTSDIPQEEYDLCVLPMSRRGESELSRDLMQQAYDRLRMEGQFVVTIDNPKDKWFHHEVEKLGKNLTRLQKRSGVVYRLRKTKPLKKRKDYSCQFAFRDRGNLVQAISRPGVFSHRRLDLGARALMETMDVNRSDHILDLGCGSGVIGLAAGRRSEDIRVHFVDANCRAVDSALTGARLNGLNQVAATLSHDGSIGAEDEAFSETFDVVVGNPPYYSHFQITEIFLQAGLNGLKPGGKIQIVTKNTEWLVARMQQLFDAVTTVEARGYSIVSGIKTSM